MAVAQDQMHPEQTTRTENGFQEYEWIHSYTQLLTVFCVTCLNHIVKQHESYFCNQFFLRLICRVLAWGRAHLMILGTLGTIEILLGYNNSLYQTETRVVQLSIHFLKQASISSLNSVVAIFCFVMICVLNSY